MVCLFFVGFLGAGAPGPWDLARPALRAHTVEGGLPENTVYDLMIDPQGRLWASTLEGLASLGARGWTPLPLPPECPSRVVRAVIPAREGGLWVGTQDGGLWRYQQGGWKGYTTAEGLPSNRVNALFETSDPGGGSSLWVGTGGGIARLRGGIWSVAPEPAPADLMVWRLREWPDEAGRPSLWAATERGLYRLAGDRWVPGLPGAPIADCNDVLVLDRPGAPREVWVSIWGKGLGCWRAGSWTLHGPAEGFQSRYPTGLGSTRDALGRTLIWAGTYDAGLRWGGPGAWNRLGMEEGLGAPGVLSLLTVNGGKPDIWIGTRGGGVVSLDLGGWRTVDRTQGVPANEVSAFAEDPATGRLWIGTGAGLVRWEAGAWRPEEGPGAPRRPLVNGLLFQKDAGGECLWVATLRGLYRIRQGRWSQVPVPGHPDETFSALASAHGENGGEVWAGGQNGLACLRPDGLQWIREAGGAPLEWVSSLATTGHGAARELWVGTWGRGVLRLREGRWARWGGAEGLPRPTVSAVLVQRGRDGRTWVWAATVGGGLARLEADRPGAAWVTYNQARLPGLPSDTLLSLGQDAAGSLYLGSARGVARVHLEDRNGEPTPIRAENFSKGDGLPTLTCVTAALHRDARERIWVGTARGAGVLDPRLETRPTAPPTPTFSFVGSSRGSRDPQGNLVFGHRETRLEFRFAFSGLHRREDVRFRTQVVGLEAEPTPWVPEDSRELTGLPPGRYRMRLWAQDFTGRQSGPVELAFRVRPAPWRSGWAWTAYGLVLAGGVLLGLKLRMRQLRRRERELEQAIEAALAEVQTLQGLIPICAYCKKIRDDRGFWAQLEHYLSAHSGAQFSHGVCPECEGTLRQELNASKG